MPQAVDLLPPRQRETLAFIVESVAAVGYPPTVTEIARGLGIVSRGSVHSHLTALESKGFLAKRYFRGYMTYWPVET